MNVLIVDDDSDVQAFLSNCVKTLGCKVVDVADSGEDALGKAVLNTYDLVTLDVKMPGVSGLDIISVIRGMMPWAVIAIVSGFPEEVTDDARAHADLMIAKPVHVEKINALVDLVRDLVAKRDAIRDLSDDAEGD
jgi:DNA-binding response OmpR family regulator